LNQEKLTSQIYILSGAVQSGKTTALMQWAAGRERIGGFLSPDVEGLRRLFTLRDRQLRPFQVAGEGEETVAVGKFRFHASAFEQGRQALLADSRAGLDWLVIDEIGKLELAGRGFEPAAGQVIRRFQEEEGEGKLLLVVRDYLLEEVVRRYGLGECVVLDASDFRRPVY
jgi:nucleoside-triphosphatase THEP1